ncbi:MAG: PEP-CTERM sorting domain-containing protein, partial [Rubripirellula sp.]
SGTEIDEIYLRSFTSSSNLIFMGIDDASTFHFSPAAINNANLLTDLDPELVVRGTIGVLDLPSGMDPDGGNNLFGVLGGSSTSLGPGTYSVYLQETGDTSNYTLNFRVSAVAVPEPSSFAAIALASIAMVRSRTRRKRTV